MADKKSRWSVDEKARIVLQAPNLRASMAETCCEHNLAPRTVYVWKEKCLAGGRRSRDGPDASKQIMRHKKEVAPTPGLILVTMC